MTKLLEQQANVDLSFTVLAATDYLQKINLMVMSGGAELTDIIIGSFDDAMVFQWAREEAIIPLTKYYNDPAKSPNIQEAKKRVKTDFIAQITSPDGEIYGFPFLFEAFYNEYFAKYMYYVPWVEKLGLKFPTTTAEYPAFLRAIANSDANGNGKKDEIPLTGQFNLNNGDYGRWFNWLMNSFVYAGDNRLLTVTNGKIGAAYTTPEWKEGLKFIRSLFAEGLIPIETLTQDGAQMRTLINTEPPVVFSFVWYNTDQINAANPAAIQYYAAPPLKGPKGVQYATHIPSTAGIRCVITKNCKNPDAAFRLGDLMTNETFSISTRFGAEGLDWDYAKNVPNAETLYEPAYPGAPLSIVTYDDSNFWGGTTPSNSSWRQQGPMINAHAILKGWANPKGVFNRDVINARISTLYFDGGWNPKEVIPKLIYNPDEMLEISEILTNLESYNTSTTAAFLSGNKDIDASWNAYQAELNNIGLPRALSIIQKVYDRMYK
jgi:putative aldouronate transport system substrate-binding protein